MADEEYKCEDIQPRSCELLIEVVDESQEGVNKAEFTVSVDGCAAKTVKPDGSGNIKVYVKPSTGEIMLTLKPAPGKGDEE
jgi:hypothetical protein